MYTPRALDRCWSSTLRTPKLRHTAIVKKLAFRYSPLLWNHATPFLDRVFGMACHCICTFNYCKLETASQIVKVEDKSSQKSCIRRMTLFRLFLKVLLFFCWALTVVYIFKMLLTTANQLCERSPRFDTLEQTSMSIRQQRLAETSLGVFTASSLFCYSLEGTGAIPYMFMFGSCTTLERNTWFWVSAPSPQDQLSGPIDLQQTSKYCEYCFKAHL